MAAPGIDPFKYIAQWDSIQNTPASISTFNRRDISLQILKKPVYVTQTFLLGNVGTGRMYGR